MASLTNYDGSETRGKAIIDPGPSVSQKGPGFLGGLLDLANQGINAVGPYQEKQRIKEQRTAQNEATRLGIATLKTTNMSEVEIMSGVETLGKARDAVRQGRLPQASVDLRLEQTLDALTTKYPDQVDAIYDVFQQRGWDHYLFRAARQENQSANNEFAEKEAGQKAAYERAVRAGVAKDTDYDWSVAQGMQLLAADEQAAQAKALFEANKAATEFRWAGEDQAIQRNAESRAATGFDQGQQSRMVRSATQTYLSVALGQPLSQISTLLAAAGNDPNKLKELEQLTPQIGAYFNSLRASMSNQVLKMGGTNEDLKAIEDQITAAEQAAGKLFTGDLSAMQRNQRALQTLQTEYKLNIAEALPAWNMLTDVLGQETVKEWLLDPQSSISPDFKEAIQKELSGLRVPGQQDSAAARINNVVNLLKGRAEFRDMNPQESVDAMVWARNAIKGNEKAILGGKTDTETLLSWNVPYSKVLTAVPDFITPNQSDLTPILNATNLVASQSARRAMDAMIKDPNLKEEGEAVMQASRRTSAFLLHSVNTDYRAEDGIQYIAFDDVTGRFIVKADRKAYNKFARGVAGGQYLQEEQYIPGVEQYIPAKRVIPSYDEFTRFRPNSPMGQRISALNANLDHLMATQKYDEEIPAGATQLSIRKWYALGQPLKNIKGEEIETGDIQFTKSVQAFSNRLRQGPGELATNPATAISLNPISLPAEAKSAIYAAAEKYNVNPAILEAVAYQESRGNHLKKGRIHTSKAGALGLMQLMPGTAQDLQVDPYDIRQNAEGGAKYLNQMLRRFGGNIELALAAYNAGPGAVEKYGNKVPPYEETQDYVKKIIKSLGG